MNQRKRHIVYPLAALVLGLAGAALRAVLYRVALDRNGLLSRSHPLTIAVWLLAAAAFILAAAGGMGSWKYNRVPDSDRRRVLAGLSEILLGVAVYATVSMDGLPGFPALLPVRKILGGVCLAVMMWEGVFHLLGKRVPFYCPAAAAVFFLLNTLSSYPAWSRDPQLMDYAFTLGAELCLCFFFYYRAALCLNLPGRKQRLVSGILGIFFCIAAIPGDFSLIHIAGSVCILATLLSGDEARS